MSKNILQNPSVGRWIAPGAIALLTIGIVTVINTHKQAAPAKAATIPASQMTPDEYQARLATPDKNLTLVFKDGKLVSGSSNITVSQNDSVNIDIKNQSAEEVKLDLDGYGIRTEADNSGGDGGFNFVADKAGTFPYFVEIEDPNVDPLAPNAPAPTKVQVGTITVQ